MKALFLFACLFLFGKAFSQKTFLIGEYITVSGWDDIYLRKTPMPNGEVLDTIQNFLTAETFYKVLDKSVINGYIKVEVVTKKNQIYKRDTITQISTLTSQKMYSKIGWISIENVIKHPVADCYNLMMYYSTNTEILQLTVENAEWHMIYDKENFKEYKCSLAAAYYYLGKIYYENDSCKKAVFYITKSNDLVPKYTNYVIRALAKLKLEDYNGVIGDCNKALIWKNPEKSPENCEPYFTSFSLEYDVLDIYPIRAYAYARLAKYTNALADYNIAIKNNKENAECYFFRGITKLNLNQYLSACQDFSKAGEYGYEKAYDYIRDYCK